MLPHGTDYKFAVWVLCLYPTPPFITGHDYSYIGHLPCCLHLLQAKAKNNQTSSERAASGTHSEKTKNLKARRATLTQVFAPLGS